jgi:E3 ubiquitin-protein ligase SIAH1
MPHLKKSHKTVTALDGEDIIFTTKDIYRAGTVDWVMIQSRFDHHFMLVLEKQDDGHQQYYATAQLIGSRKQAENFEYKLELKREGKRLTWEATTRSIREQFSTIMKSECLVFDTNIAQLFVDNGYLSINVKISKVETGLFWS